MELPEGVSFKDKNIIVVSPGRTNEDIIHLFITLGLLKKAGARQIVIVEPYMGYSRQHTFFVDKKAYGANSTKIIFDIFNGLRGDGFEIVAAIGDTIHYAREGVAKTESALPPQTSCGATPYYPTHHCLFNCAICRNISAFVLNISGGI